MSGRLTVGMGFPRARIRAPRSIGSVYPDARIPDSHAGVMRMTAGDSSKENPRHTKENPRHRTQGTHKCVPSLAPSTFCNETRKSVLHSLLFRALYS